MSLRSKEGQDHFPLAIENSDGSNQASQLPEAEQV